MLQFNLLYLEENREVRGILFTAEARRTLQILNHPNLRQGQLVLQAALGIPVCALGLLLGAPGLRAWLTLRIFFKLFRLLF